MRRAATWAATVAEVRAMGDKALAAAHAALTARRRLTPAARDMLILTKSEIAIRRVEGHLAGITAALPQKETPWLTSTP